MARAGGVLTVGGTDAEAYREATEEGRLGEVPTNHSPRFTPVLHTTLRTGIETSVAATGAWLGAPAGERRSVAVKSSPATST